MAYLKSDMPGINIQDNQENMAVVQNTVIDGVAPFEDMARWRPITLGEAIIAAVHRHRDQSLASTSGASTPMAPL